MVMSCLTLFSGRSKGYRHWRQPADITRNNITRKNCTSCLSHTHSRTHTQEQTEAVYHIGPNFSSASMRSASTTASHRPLTWTTGLGEMWWESSPLSWNTAGCSRCRVRTSSHPVTFLKPERKRFYIGHVWKLAQLSWALKQLHWGWIRKWKCLGSWTASMSWLFCLPVRYTTLPFYPAFSWIKGKLATSHNSNCLCGGLKATEISSVCHLTVMFVEWTITGWVSQMQPFLKA